MQEARVCSHDRPIGRCQWSDAHHILMMDQSDAGSAGIFSRQTNRTPFAERRSPYSHDGPVGHRKRGYILTKDQSDAVNGATLTIFS
eukprot:931785-Pyramimonas_sp.AAC.2